MLSGRGAGSVDALRRFSRAIPFFVALLVTDGGLLAIIQVETPTALWTTSYGRVLLIKLAMLAGLFGLAIVNRYRFTPPADHVMRAPTASLNSNCLRIQLAARWTIPLFRNTGSTEDWSVSRGPG